MRTSHSIGLLLAMSCCVVLSAEPLTNVVAFSKLTPSDTLAVRFHSTGCFHDETYELTFRRASEPTVSIVHLPCVALRPGLVAPQTNRVDLGTLTLSKSDIAGLDKLMAFYRSNRDWGCTTMNAITFTQQRDGETVAAQQITDGSCRIFQMKQVTSFEELIHRLDSTKR